MGSGSVVVVGSGAVGSGWGVVGSGSVVVLGSGAVGSGWGVVVGSGSVLVVGSGSLLAGSVPLSCLLADALGSGSAGSGSLELGWLASDLLDSVLPPLEVLPASDFEPLLDDSSGSGSELEFDDFDDLPPSSVMTPLRRASQLLRTHKESIKGTCKDRRKVIRILR